MQDNKSFPEIEQQLNNIKQYLQLNAPLYKNHIP